MGRAIGITGGIASGKTSVRQLLNQAGFLVIDADQIAHQILDTKTPTLTKVVQQFGTQILTADGQLNRAILGQIVFADTQQLERLNQIVQPAIRQELVRQIQQAQTTAQTVFFEIPLLFEQHYEQIVDQVLVVYVTEQVQLQRLQERNHLTVQQACSRIKSQLPIQQKCRLADFVIDNTGDWQHLQQQVDQFLQQVIKE